ncbi:YlxP-like protein [hydrothermal vent metagenome]|uniref:YlxP-like protein n=1 Tax=hydrothermal vent metagenome TaxID=652676 RepID=A0A3B0X9H8_9ZZZZ
MLEIPQAHSLKDKRRQIKSLKERIMSRFNASVAEVDYLDNWQKSVLAICMVSNDKSYLDKQFSLLETRVLEYAEIELLSMDREWL